MDFSYQNIEISYQNIEISYQNLAITSTSLTRINNRRILQTEMESCFTLRDYISVPVEISYGPLRLFIGHTPIVFGV